MKKYLLLIISMVCAVTGAWADIPDGATAIGENGSYYLLNGSTYTIHVEASDKDLAAITQTVATNNCAIKVTGTISQTGINKIASTFLQQWSITWTQLDLSDAIIDGSFTEIENSSKQANVESIIMPKDGTMPDETLIRTGPANTTSAMNNGGTLKYVIVPSSDGSTISIFFTRQQYGGTGVLVSTEVIGADPYFANANCVLVQYETDIDTNSQETMNEYIFNTSNKQHAFDGIITVSAGSSLGDNINTKLGEYYQATISDITRLNVTGELTTTDVEWLNTNKDNLTRLTTLDLTGANFGSGVTKASIAAAVPSTTTVLYPASYTISDGCTVTIDMGKAMGDDLATILAQAKTDLGSTDICTLIVTGPVSNNDLIALGGSNMTGATRIDLSGATIASSSSIESITLPASLEQLILPKGMGTAKLPDALRSKFAGASNLMYAYSPTSDAQTVAAQHVADLVWVNKAGGLDKAIINEAKLRTAIYVKVESSVALNANDVDLANNNKQTGENTYENVSLNNISTDATNYAWQYIDMSSANLQNDVIVSYKAPQTTNSYRLILPDGWGPNRMSIIPSLEASNYGSGLAAVYSYTAQGFLQILEINDTEYKPGALADNRIVRGGTKAVRVVSGEYNGTTYGSFGEYNNGNQNHLLEAINAASPSIEAITITNTRCVQSSISIDNDNLIYIQIEGIKNANNYDIGPTLNVDGCKNLGTLNLINSVFASVDASVPALEASGNDPSTTGLTAVNMSGTKVNGITDLSTSPITNIGFVTNSDTWFQNGLDLSKTALTTFTTTAKVGTTTANTGDIILNENELTGVSLNQVQFQNTSSKVEVRKSADSSSSDYEKLIESLDADNTIIVPEGFDAEHRIVPYVAKSVKKEQYVAPAYVFSATDMYLHEKEETDKFVYWYTGEPQDNKVLTITMTDERRGTLATLLGSGYADINSSTKLVRLKIVGPLASNDLAALASVNAQILDLSEATLQRKSSDTYTNDVTIFENVSDINQHVKFLLLPAGMTRDDVYNGDTKVSDGIVNKTSLAGFTGLYSAISLTDYNPNNAFDFTSYNKVAGTLQPAVIAAGRGTLNGSQMIRGEEGSERTAYYPTMSGNYNRSATISGLINAYDLSYGAKLDADGHLKFNKRYADESLDADDRTNAGTETNIQGAFSGSNGPRTLDLKAAEITGPEYINDICISYLVPTNMLKYLIIPETESVKETPSYFIQHNTVKEICIPSNIEVIRTHFAPSLDHIWTTAATGATGDANGTVFDNGAWPAVDQPLPQFGYTDYNFGANGLYPHGTYTFSSNLKMIESKAFANSTPHVSDVYVLAKQAPECHVDAFCIGMYIGHSGFAPNIVDGVITRDSYVNGNNWITMLHYPRECATPNVQRYTDPTRNYSVASNEVDGKGGVLYYPNYGEFLAAYAQGTTGYLWNAWSREYEFGMLKSSLSIGNTGWTLKNQQDANAKFLENPDLIAAPENTKWTCTSFYDVTADGTENQPNGLVPYYDVRWNEVALSNKGAGVQLYHQKETDTDLDSDGTISSKDYRGWHQFVLNAYAANTDIPMQPSRSYITENRWYTVCLPYDLTWKEMLLFFGTVTFSGTTTTVDETKLPQLCLLSNVVRDEVNSHITLNFSKNLMEYQAEKSADGVWTVSDEKLTDAQKAQTGTNDYVVLHAGVPYLIKPYLSSNDATRQFDVYDAGQTLGDYTDLSKDRIMVSSNNYPGLYTKLKNAENMSGTKFREMLQTNLYTVPALLPLNGDTYPSTNKENYIKDGDVAEVITIGSKKYYRSADFDYTFVGSFMKNVLPPYCYFLGYNSATKKSGFYYADYLKLAEGSALRKMYENEMLWANNQGVICPNFLKTTSTTNKYNLGHEGGHDGLVTEAVANGEKSTPAQWKIFGTTGNNVTAMLPNDLWGTSTSSAPTMMFGLDIDRVDNEATGINAVKTNDVMNAEGAKVFNLEGRCVGNSLEGLEKGIYIQNGKKIMVK